jgi:S1-C subfamily serine protease
MLKKAFLLPLLLTTGMAQVEKPDVVDADVKKSSARQATLRTDAILKVNVTYQEYSLHQPWEKQSPSQRRGLGAVLAGNRVLLTGQMVADATYIELELPDGSQKLPGKVVAVDYEANVALVEAAVDGERAAEFFGKLKPIELDTKASIGDMLSIWQTGRVGELLVTPLRIGKINTQRYAVENAVFLVYEGQGILRSEGNSYCLPVVKGGKLAGLMLRYDSKNQVTTVLPAPIIEHFLKDFADDGKVDGFPSIGVEMANTQDEQFREYLKLKPEQGGMFVNNIVKGGSADNMGMKKGDIVLNVAGKALDNRGDYEDPDYGKLSFGHLIRGRSYVGDELAVKVLRDGQEVELKGKLSRKNANEYLVPPYRFDRGPNYLVQGGLVFQELNKPYLQSWGDNQNATVARLNHIASHTEDYEKAGFKKLIVITKVLPTSGLQGYDRVSGQIVQKVNGMEIKSLNDLDAAFKAPKNGLHTIELDIFPKVVYLDALTAERDNMALLKGAFRIGSLKRMEN